MTLEANRFTIAFLGPILMNLFFYQKSYQSLLEIKSLVDNDDDADCYCLYGDKI